MSGQEKSFPKCSERGGYTIIYIDRCNVLCANCAKEHYEQTGETPDSEIYWEGSDLHCENCNETIESSYGDPEENT